MGTRWFRRAVLGAAVAAGLSLVVAAWPARGQGGPAPELERLTAAQAVFRGRHVRLELPAGPVHVWIPAGYHSDNAATVVYVHGYYDTVDEAWSDHRLAEQFALSGLSALFIAPEAPDGVGQAVHFPDLVGLVAEVEAQLGVWRGSGPLVAIGHSGGYRTLERWLAEPMLEVVICLDSLYGDEALFAEWLAASPEHRLVTVGDDTVRWTEALAMAVPDTVIVDRFPFAPEEWSDAARSARHLYVRSQLGHMALVTDGLAIPLLLRLLPVPRLPETAWHQAIGERTPPWMPSGLPDVR